MRSNFEELEKLEKLASRCKWICINILQASCPSNFYVKYGTIGKQIFRISGGVHQDVPCDMYCICKYEKHLLVCTAKDQHGNQYSIEVEARPTGLNFHFMDEENAYTTDSNGNADSAYRNTQKA